MKCKRCKREIADNSIFCNWCGHKQLTAADDVRVPKPHRGETAFYAQLMVDGERIYISGETEEDYYAKARATKSRLLEIKKHPAKAPLGKVVDKYIKDNEGVLSESTIRAYKSYRRNRFQAYMDKSTDAINYQEMVARESKTVSPKTVSNAYRLITASLSYSGIPVPSVNLPKISKTERPWLDYAQIKTLCKAVKGKPYETAVLLALNGLRRSELLHITSNDIDLTHNIIHVRGASIIGVDGTLVDKKTNKNATSTRDVHIVIPRLVELLRNKEGTIVTTKPNTTYMEVNKVCRSLGLPEVGVHGLRHSFASLAYHLKWSEATTMREGGWANTATVHKVYTHLAAQDANKDIARMRAFYNS